MGVAEPHEAHPEAVLAVPQARVPVGPLVACEHQPRPILGLGPGKGRQPEAAPHRQGAAQGPPDVVGGHPEGARDDFAFARRPAHGRLARLAVLGLVKDRHQLLPPRDRLVCGPLRLDEALPVIPEDLRRSGRVIGNRQSGPID